MKYAIALTAHQLRHTFPGPPSHLTARIKTRYRKFFCSNTYARLSNRKSITIRLKERPFLLIERRNRRSDGRRRVALTLTDPMNASSVHH
jgi:hypothetical protein